MFFENIITTEGAAFSGVLFQMEYDSYNRIRKVTNPDKNDELAGQYWYDDQGFRVRKIARRDSGLEQRLVEVLYPSMYFGVERQKTPEGDPIPDTGYAVNNIYLGGVRIAAVIPSGDAQYYLTDQVDSVKVVVDDDGKPVSRMEYLPYGETWFEEGNTNNAPKYNSQELDKETGFYFYNARHYDPQVSRFVTADTVVPRENDTQSWNRFSYCVNNPIILKDPSGHEDIVVAQVPGKNDRLESKAFVFPDGTLTKANVFLLKLDYAVLGKIVDPEKLLKINTGKDPKKFDNFTSLPDDTEKYGTQKSGEVYDYKKQSMPSNPGLKSYIISDPKLGEGKVPQDPKHGDPAKGIGKNPFAEERTPPYVEGTFMHTSKSDGSGSGGCVMQKGFEGPSGLATYLEQKQREEGTGDKGKILILRFK